MKRELSILETEFLELLSELPASLEPLLELIVEAETQHDPTVASEWSNILLQELQSLCAIRPLFAALKARQQVVATLMSPKAVREMLEKACKDRMVKAMLEEINFSGQPLSDSIAQLDLLLTLAPGTLVISHSWGLGSVKRVDDFYKRVNIDFATRKGHALSFGVAISDLLIAPDNHLLTIHYQEPEAIATMVQQNQAELVKLALHSFGDMNVSRLEEQLTTHKILLPEQWKSFWDNARKTLRNDPLVVLPAKRSDNLTLLAQAEDYGAAWFARLADELNVESVVELITTLKGERTPTEINSLQRDIIADRLSFALKYAHNTEPALYARLALLTNHFEVLTDRRDSISGHLWEDQRYIEAALTLTQREISDLTTLLLASHSNASSMLLEALPSMNYNMVSEVLAQLHNNPSAGAVCCDLLAQPQAPHTLVNWTLRHYRAATWTMPATADLLLHGIATVEASLSGENLRMQNAIRQLFEQPKWLEQEFNDLNAAQRRFIFERIQASIHWESGSQRKLINLMLKLDPQLKSSRRVVATEKAEQLHLTSWRSLNERKKAYKQLVEVEMPKNSSDIATARSYGDLRENFEYQAAKEYQGQLLKRQADMQQDLEKMAGTDFANIATDKVAPGTSVRLKLEDGTTLTYTILGEWDFDKNLNIISNRTRLAQLLIGLTPDSKVNLPGVDGEREAVIEAILPLSTEIIAWINSDP